MKRTRSLLMVLVTLILTFTINLAVAGSHSTILPPNSHAYGKSYAEWSAAWLKWALSIPAGSNPILDNTGAYAAIGQSGKVWFLAGTTGAGAVPPVRRTISIPTGTPLFFPIINYFWVNTPEYGDPNWSPTQEANARNQIAAVIDTVRGISLIIDGKPVPGLYDFRIQSKATLCRIPPLAADNIFGADLKHNPYHCVADGYWALIPPLSVGTHTIHFAGEDTLPALFSLDVTYKITVKPKRRTGVSLHP